MNTDKPDLLTAAKNALAKLDEFLDGPYDAEGWDIHGALNTAIAREERRRPLVEAVVSEARRLYDGDGHIGDLNLAVIGLRDFDREG